MGEMGKAMMGTGEASGDNRAIEAAEQAIANPLLDGVSMKGAKGVIISITGGEDMRLMEVDEAANHIKELVDPDANIIWGSAFNNDLEGKIRVSVVATGIDADAVAVPAAPAKVFAFPGGSREAPTPAVAAAPAPIKVPTAAPVQAAAPAPKPAPLRQRLSRLPLRWRSGHRASCRGPAPTISFDDEAEGGEELLLDAGSMMKKRPRPRSPRTVPAAGLARNPPRRRSRPRHPARAARCSSG
jgi:cell division protein FtsZ